jgi:hypothetical protein
MTYKGRMREGKATPPAVLGVEWLRATAITSIDHLLRELQTAAGHRQIETIIRRSRRREPSISRCSANLVRLWTARLARLARKPSSADLYGMFAVRLNAPLDRVEEVSGEVVSDAPVARRLP